jgi:hypothetical protein
MELAATTWILIQLSERDIVVVAWRIARIRCGAQELPTAMSAGGTRNNLGDRSGLKYGQTEGRREARLGVGSFAETACHRATDDSTARALRA